MKVQTIQYNDPNAPQKFVASLRETGFAVVSNHPISTNLIHDSFKEWETFFKSEEKYKYTFDPKKQAGYFPFRTENAKDSSKKDLKEFFHFYPWSELPSQANVNTPKLYKELLSMGSTLLRWIDSNTPAEVRKNFSLPLYEMIEKSTDTLLRPIHYPPLTGAEEAGAVRAAAHEDINLITLLPAATEPGLQVKDTAGRWHDVSCDPGTIVVNSGDMLTEASRGYYPSTTHQVVNPSAEKLKNSRYSMPLFLHPFKTVQLSEKYTAGSYLEERLRAIGLLPKEKN